MKYLEQMEGVCQKLSSTTNKSKSKYCTRLSQHESFYCTVELPLLFSLPPATMLLFFCLRGGESIGDALK